MKSHHSTRRILTTVLTATACSLIPVAAGAQDFPYTMTQFTAPYVPLGSYLVSLQQETFETSLIQGDSKDNALPVFHYLGYRMDTIKIYPRGVVGVYTAGAGWIGQISALTGDRVARSKILPADRSSAFGIAVDGAIESRILKIEWKNLTVPMDNPDNGLDSINYQLWLYENTNVIEIRVGPSHVISTITDFEEPVSGPFLGLIQPPSEVIPEPKGMYYTGSPDAPVRNPWSLGVSFAPLLRFPKEGTVYRFTADGSSDVLEEPGSVGSVMAYPNPATSSTTISFDLKYPAECELVIHNAFGREQRRLLLGQLSAGEQNVRLATEELPAGIYFYTLSSRGQRLTRPFVVE